MQQVERERALAHTAIGVIVGLLQACGAPAGPQAAPQASPRTAASDQCAEYQGHIAVVAADSVGAGTLLGRILGLRLQTPLDKVNVVLDEGRSGQAQTGPDGDFVISGVAPGPHWVIVRSIGFVSRRADFALDQRRGAVVTAQLAPAMFDGPCSGFSVPVSPASHGP